jgi:(2Fe-2S) ferredoxin
MQSFGAGIESRGLFNKAILSTSSCLGPCSMGPVVIVYPDAVWYSNVTPKDVDEILDQHIGGGKPVQRLVLPDAVWG